MWIRAPYRQGKVFETAAVTSPDIRRRNIVASGKDPPLDAHQVDFYDFRADVDEHDPEAQSPGPNHHLNVVPAGKRSLDGEALAPPEVCLGQMQNFSAGSDG